MTLIVKIMTRIILQSVASQYYSQYCVIFFSINKDTNLIFIVCIFCVYFYVSVICFPLLVQIFVWYNMNEATAQELRRRHFSPVHFKNTKQARL